MPLALRDIIVATMTRNKSSERVSEPRHTTIGGAPNRHAGKRPSPLAGRAPGKGKPAHDAKPAHNGGRRSKSGHEPVWLWGGHAVLAALANPQRRCRRLLLAEGSQDHWLAKLTPLLAARDDLPPEPEVQPRKTFDRLLPDSSVHQGLALLADPLDQPDLEVLLTLLPEDRPVAIVLLDQISDPQNAGAVLRSAAAFGASAVVTTKRNAPAETGALAKAASGALEHVPFLHLPNLSRAMERMQEAGLRVLGLAEEGSALLREAADSQRIAIVLGAEGSGLRRLTRERCDGLVRLPTQGDIAALNVSNAAAVALYEVLGRRRG